MQQIYAFSGTDGYNWGNMAACSRSIRATHCQPCSTSCRCHWCPHDLLRSLCRRCCVSCCCACCGQVCHSWVCPCMRDRRGPAVVNVQAVLCLCPRQLRPELVDGGVLAPQLTLQCTQEAPMSSRLHASSTGVTCRRHWRVSHAKRCSAWRCVPAVLPPRCLSGAPEAVRAGSRAARPPHERRPGRG